MPNRFDVHSEGDLELGRVSQPLQRAQTTPPVDSCRTSLDEDFFHTQPCEVFIHDDLPSTEGTASQRPAHYTSHNVEGTYDDVEQSTLERMKECLKVRPGKERIERTRLTRPGPKSDTY
jgi:hypothetical protein